MFRRATIVAVSALLLIAADEKLTPYENQQHGFKLSFPAQLSVMDPPDERTIVYLGTQPDGPNDVYTEDVRLILAVARLKVDSLDQLVAAFEKSMTGSGKKIVESKRSELGGQPAQRVVYTNEIELPDGKINVKAVIYITIKGQSAYGLDARATDKTFDTFIPIAQKVFDSFQWTGGDKK